MEALISGRAGLALVVDGDRFTSIHAAEPERMVPRQPAEFRYLVGEARDFVTLENVTRHEIVSELLLAEDREDALQLILMAQDPDLPDDIRREAIEDLERVILEHDVGSYLENVLYAHPLPESLDLAGAMKRARTAEAWETLALLELLWTHQDAIREVRQAWESIPLTDFSDEDDHWQATAVRQGLFRDLARLRARGRSVNELFVDIENRPEISALPNHRSVLHRWLDNLLTCSLTEAESTVDGGVSIIREPETEYWAGVALARKVVQPLIQSSGGEVEVLRVEDGTVHLRLREARGASGARLEKDIEVALKEAFPGFRIVVQPAGLRTPK